MNFPLFIARRYFFSRKISNVINIISGISLVGVMVGTFALIVVLSVFNGFENVVISLFNSFDSDLKVTPATGKYFHPDSASYLELSALDEVAGITPVIEDNVLIRYDESQEIATLKAVQPHYLRTTGIDSMIFAGESRLEIEDRPVALLGSGVAAKLGVNIHNEFTALQVHVPNKAHKPTFTLTPTQPFRKENLYPAGVFSIQQDFDAKYVLAPLGFARELMDEPERATAIEINLWDEDDLSDVKEKVQALVGPDFVVQDRFEQHALLYRIMKSEKLAVYLILSFILLIAAFNLIGSLIMLAIEKRKDVAILKSMGADSSIIRKIFLYEGMIISAIGAVVGMALGYLTGWLQQEFALVKINTGSTFVLNAYPVDFLWTDFIAVFFTALLVGLIASYIPARIAYKRLSIHDLAQ